MADYVKIGEKYDLRPAVFELVVYDHVPFVNPLSYGLTAKEYKVVDPAQYYVTSGDAVEKAKILKRDMMALVEDVKMLSCQFLMKELQVDKAKALLEYSSGVRPTKPKKFEEYENDVQSAAQSVKRMLKALIKAKGDDCFLETEWDGHQLLCIPKNPRGQK